MNNKKCYACKILKPLEDFHKDKGGCDGRQGTCKVCKQVIAKNWYAKNRERSRHNNLFYTYGIGKVEYDIRMSTSSCCEICGSNIRLCYDHNHNTMKFRGVLCQKCNTGIGLLGDTLEDVLKAVDYLRRT